MEQINQTLTRENAENKMGTRPILPLLATMAVPAMVSMFIQSMYNVVDSMFVARISMDALTAVSLAFPIQNLILSVAVGTGVGVNSLISRNLGAQRFDEANSAVTHGIIMSGVTWVLFVLFGLFLTEPFFRMFADSEAIFTQGVQYTRIITFLSFGTLIHICIEKVLQATGKMIYPMIFQAIGAIINIILDPIMIFGLFGCPAMGVSGAAIATIIGQVSAMLLAVIVLVAKSHDVKIKTKGFRFQFATLKKIYGVGIPSILMMSLGSVLVMGLNGILVRLSDLGVALFGIYFKLQSFVFMPVSGLTQGAMPIMGYNFGAQNKDRLLGTLRTGLMIASGIMVIGVLLFLLIPEQLLLLFDAPEEMMEIGIPALRIICISYIPAAFGFLYSTLFQAIGKGLYSLIISLLRQLVIILPLSLILANALGLVGVWITFPIAETVAAAVAVWLFRRENKKEFGC